MSREKAEKKPESSAHQPFRFKPACWACGFRTTNSPETEKEYVGGRIDRYENYDGRGNAQTVITAYGSPEQRIVYYTYHPDIDATLSRSEASLLGGGTTTTIWDYDKMANGVGPY